MIIKQFISEPLLRVSRDNCPTAIEQTRTLVTATRQRRRRHQQQQRQQQRQRRQRRQQQRRQQQQRQLQRRQHQQQFRLDETILGRIWPREDIFGGR